MLVQGDELEPYVVQPSDSLRSALQKIEGNKHRVVVVVKEGYVMGTLSDGDVRRAVLRNVLPIAAVSTVMNVNCKRCEVIGEKEGSALIAREKVTVLPVVDEENRLLGIHAAYEPFVEEGDE